MMFVARAAGPFQSRGITGAVPLLHHPGEQKHVRRDHVVRAAHGSHVRTLRAAVALGYRQLLLR